MTHPTGRGDAADPAKITPVDPILRFRCAERSVGIADRSATILDIAIRNGVPIWCECGGRARCTTCRVRVLDGAGNVAPRNAAETKIAALRGWEPSVRLACQTRITGNVTIERLIRHGMEVSPLQLETVEAQAGDERQLAILFCDVRDFTRIAESQLSYDVVHILNKLFAALGEPILLNNGVIYQYVGDEITGLFGLESQTSEQACLSAVRAALGMLDALDKLNDTLSREYGMRLSVGLGLHFGPVVIGRIGHPTHRHFGVVGDTINVASRIQTMNKRLGTSILASAPVIEALPPGTLILGKSDSAILRGRHHPTDLFELKAFAAPDPLLIVQSTVDTVLAQRERLTRVFYRRLFARAPQLRGLFPEDMEPQARKLGQMLEVIVYAFSRPEQLAMGLHGLGARHVAYGVKPEDYALVRQPLLAAVVEVLSQSASDEVVEAWSGVVDTVLRLMRHGAGSVSSHR